jgi:hypothetical protein
MATYMVFGRREYAEPLAHLRDIDADSPPALDALDIGDGWLEVSLVPGDAAIWVLHDGKFVVGQVAAEL